MHGGDIYRNRVKYDFSVNVNPMGMPPGVRDALTEAIHHAGEYPDLRHEALSEKLSDHFDLPSEWFVLGNGASELIAALPRALNPRCAMYPLPSYQGYSVALQNGSPKCNILWIPLTESHEFQMPENLPFRISRFRPDLVILTNPHNPTGQLISRNKILEIAEACKQVGGTLLLDECFMALTGREKECSLISKDLTEYPNVVVLRAFTKTYAIPGVRLGYAICSDAKRCQAIRRQLPEWNLSVFAERAGIACLESGGYLEKSVSRIREERRYLREGLSKLGFRVYSSEANYLMFHTDILNLAEKLLEQGVLIRSFGDEEGLDTSFYRIAVLNREKNQILLDTIHKCCEI